MKKLRKILFILTVFVMCLSISTPASAAVKISSKSVTLTAGQKKQLKVTGTKKKVKWSSDKKKVATVNQKGVVTAKSAGTAKITAKVGSKKYTCTVKVAKKTNSGSYKTYGESTYRVGSTIPAGQYALFATGSISGYFEISSDSTGNISSIIANDNFDYNSIVTVRNGQYLKLVRCKAIPIAKAKISSNVKGGMYRVGIDIKPGEYMLESTSSTMGYYEVDSSDSHSVSDIVSNDNFNGATYVTVENGQYLKLVRCKLSKYRKL